MMRRRMRMRNVLDTVQSDGHRIAVPLDRHRRTFSSATSLVEEPSMQSLHSDRLHGWHQSLP
jgi:hypothetical protein